MDLGVRVSRGRLVAVWSGVTAGVVAVLALLLPAVLAGPGASFDATLVWGCGVAAGATSCWLWVVATVVTADALRGLATVRRGVPAGLRRALLVLGGAAIASGLAVPVVAAGQGPVGPQVLAGLRLPERVAVEPAAATPAARPAARPVASTVEVAPGDTLWDIAARRLGDATSWTAIYALNRDVIGPDPGSITPGQQLILPSEPAGGAR